jgi:hypothetical protein
VAAAFARGSGPAEVVPLVLRVDDLLGQGLVVRLVDPVSSSSRPSSSSLMDGVCPGRVGANRGGVTGADVTAVNAALSSVADVTDWLNGLIEANCVPAMIRPTSADNCPTSTVIAARPARDNVPLSNCTADSRPRWITA